MINSIFNIYAGVLVRLYAHAAPSGVAGRCPPPHKMGGKVKIQGICEEFSA